MTPRTLPSRLRTLGAAGVFSLVALAAVVAPRQAAATTLSDNTSQTAADTVSAAGNQWLAASFIPDADYGSVTVQAVLQALADSGTSTLSLYSSDASGLVPEGLVGTFQTVSTTDSSTLFSLSSVTLQSSASYWLVLSNANGNTNWSWTESSEGLGTGFTGNWANSDDAGGVWFANSNLYPLQLSVAVNAVPEPSTRLLWLSGLPMLAAARRRLARHHQAC